jgi:hypothetical protein
LTGKIENRWVQVEPTSELSRKMGTSIGTSIALKRIEFGADEYGVHNFLFEIKVETSIVFALSVPVVSAKPNQMLVNAYEVLSGVLHSAAKEATKLAQYHEVQLQPASRAKRMTPEEEELLPPPIVDEK